MRHRSAATLARIERARPVPDAARTTLKPGRCCSAVAAVDLADWSGRFRIRAYDTAVQDKGLRAVVDSGVEDYGRHGPGVRRHRIGGYTTKCIATTRDTFMLWIGLPRVAVLMLGVGLELTQYR